MKAKICSSCGYEIPEGIMPYKLDGEIYCDGCTTTCEICDEVILRDNGVYIEGEEILVCESCYDNEFVECVHCGNDVRTGDSITLYNGDEVCEWCYDDNYRQCNRCGDSFHMDNLRYVERYDEYVCEYCYSPSDDRGLFSYHSGEGRSDKSNDYRYRIGFEVEKEDYDVIEDIDIYDILNTTGWTVEEDGSLNDECGFEAISPIYPLLIGKLEHEFKCDTLKELINASHSSNCGGHITISDVKRTPEQIIDDITGYLPMLYALFPHRTWNSYCEAKPKEEYKMGGRSALYIRGHNRGSGLEIRLFDSPRDTKDLMVRARILKYMLQVPARTVEQGLEILSSSNRLRGYIKKFVKISKLDPDNFYKDLVRFARDYEKKRIKGMVSKISKKKL